MRTGHLPAPEELSGRTVVITGGNSGIGLETAVVLAAAGAEVILGCRNATKAAEAVATIERRTGSTTVEHRPLDLADLESVERFATSLLADRPAISLLINNAGLILDERRETAQGFEATFGINHLGPFHLTNLLLDAVRAGGTLADPARIVNLSSLAHWAAVGGMRWHDLDRRHRFHAMRVYGETKLANLLHAMALAERLGDAPIVTHAVHPGPVATGFGKDGDTSGMEALALRLSEPFMLTPAQGARTSIHVATSPEAARSTGRYWAGCRPARTAPWVSLESARQLWQVSESMLRLAGVTPN